jgi:hypothetical protein
MLIFEVENTGVDTGKLTALSTFLAGRAEDTDAKKQISTATFIKLAQSLGVAVTADDIGELIAQPPLSDVLEPYEPNTNIIKFKGNTDVTPGMNVDQAEKIVNQNAKSAMRRGLNK